jgi:hypothetical protein
MNVFDEKKYAVYRCPGCTKRAIGMWNELSDCPHCGYSAPTRNIPGARRISHADIMAGRTALSDEDASQPKQLELMPVEMR